MNSKWIKFLIIILVITLAIIVFWPKDQPGNLNNANSGFADENQLDDSENITEPWVQIEDFAWDDRDIFKSGLTIEAQGDLAKLPTASVYHLSIQIPENLSEELIGHLSVHYFNNEDQSLGEVYFRTFPNYNGGSISVFNLTVDGVIADSIFESNDTALRVDLPANLEPGESTVIEMDFNLDIPTEMGGNYGLFGYFENILVLDTFFPVIPAYDEKGWYKEAPQPNGDLSYQDASFYLVHVNAPIDMVLVASGVEIERFLTEDRQNIIYAAGPARDFYLAGSKSFTKLSKQIGEITVNSYTLPEYSLHQQYALDYATLAIDLMGQRFGNYPYTEFDILSSPMLALGVEYPGVTSVIVNEYVAGEFMYDIPTESMLESTVVHEVGHQWFYNGVGNDQQNLPWVDEALTQYATYLYYLDAYGREAGNSFLDSFNSRWSRVDFAEIPIGMPAGSYRGAEYSAIVYGRGPLFFYELEKEIGLDNVSEAIRNYYQSNLWGIANSQDIRYFFEIQCACDLGDYFEEWIYEN